MTASWPSATLCSTGWPCPWDSATLVVGSYAWGVACSLILTSTVIKLSFQGFNTIDHFFCEFSSLLSLSCSDTYLNQLLLFIFSTFNEVSTLFIIPVLCVYCCRHPPDAFSLWSPQSLLHLCLTPHHHQHLPWHHPLPLLCAQLQKLQAHSQSGICILHGGHPHVESPDLQSEK